MLPVVTMEKRNTDMKERLVAEALAHFEGGGCVGDFSLRSVARAAECSHANVYHYVDGAEGLVREAYLRALAGFRDECLAKFGARSRKGGVGRAWSLAFVGFCLDRPGLFRLLWIEKLPGEAPEGFMESVREVSSEYVRLVVSQLSDSFTAAEAAEIAEVFFSYAQGCLSLFLNGRLAVPPRSENRATLLARLERMWILLTQRKPARRGG